MGDARSSARRKSASTASLREQDMAHTRRLTIRQRMLLALELGRRGRMIQKRVQKNRALDASRA